MFSNEKNVNGYHQKAKLATELPSWLVEKPDDFDRMLNEQLDKLQTHQIDLYLLHALNSNYWQKLRDWKVLSWAEKAIADGRIRHLGIPISEQLKKAHAWLDPLPELEGLYLNLYLN